MALYSEVANDFKEKVNTSEFFRLEGYISQNRLNSENQRGYIYLSGTQDHHMYFAMRRIKQLIDQTLKESCEMDLTRKNLIAIYSQLKDIISHNDISGPLHSTRVLCTGELGKLISENSKRPSKKTQSERCIEHSDASIYGGGYGLADEWRTLFGYLTYFTATTRISRDDIIEILARMKKTGKLSSKEHFAQIVGEVGRYDYEIGKNVQNDFGKYNIMDTMDRIIEKKLIMPDSDLAKHPKATVKRVIEDYEHGRRMLIKSLEQQERMRNMTR